MKVVYRYVMPNPGFWRKIELPQDAECVRASTRGQQLVAWFLVDLTKPLVERHFTVVPTGDQFPLEWVFHRSILDGPIVLHLVEDTTPEVDGRDYG